MKWVGRALVLLGLAFGVLVLWNWSGGTDARDAVHQALTWIGYGIGGAVALVIALVFLWFMA